MLEEFKKSALKGNLVDTAVGIIAGAAFGNVVKSLKPVPRGEEPEPVAGRKILKQSITP